MSTRLFPAVYGGRCDANGCRIEPDDMIGYSDDYDKPLCKQCWTLDQGPPEPVCGSCFTVHAGECL